jgi:hypothetical protein
MPDADSDVLDAAHQIFVLAFDLADAEITRLPDQLNSALTSPLVQAAIEKTLLDFLKTTPAAGNTVMSGAEAQKLVTALEKGVGDPLSKELRDKIKATPEFKRLEKSIEAFKKAAASSTLGVWVDKNKNVLYVVGAALVVGTATALYVTKTGGALLNTALDPLKGKEFEVLQIGKLGMKAGLWDFKPDARVLGARVLGTVDWEKIKLDLKFGILAEGAVIQEVEGAAVLKSGAFSITMTGSDKIQAHQVNLGLNVGYEKGNFNLGVGAMYKDDALSGTANLFYKTKNVTYGLQGNIGEQKGGGMQYGAMFLVTIPIGR